MKKIILPIVSCLLILGITVSCKRKFDEKKYLTEILNNLEQVKSASYISSVSASSAMGDIAAIRYIKEFFNPADTAIGSSFGWFYSTDTTKLDFAYDGNAKITMYDNDKKVSIDSFKVYRLPVRIVGAPFFNYTKNVIEYALTTNDSILKEFHDFGDSLLFSLTIYSDKQVVFFGKPVPMYFSIPNSIDEVNKYDVWINKSTRLPYKYKRTMSHQTSWEEINDIQINKIDIKDFIPSRYIPADYDIYVVGSQERIASPEENLTGKTAPDWTLSDYNNESFALKDFKSKVLLLQFSGIGCPPCHASLPFLNQLTNDYKDKSFELVRIECWHNNTDMIKRYISTNDIKYKFLIKDAEIEKNYNILAVPTLFILDNNRVIQKVVRGYSTELEKEIRETIEKLL